MWGDAGPTRAFRSYKDRLQLQEKQRRELRLVLLRALSDNQILLLSNIRGSRGITQVINSVSSYKNIPISTLKSSSKVLRDLGLIRFSKGFPVEITKSGRFILNILGGELNE